MKSFNELGFKEGDKVRCLSTSSSNFYGLGEVYTLKINNYGLLGGYAKSGIGTGFNGRFGTWELVVDKRGTQRMRLDWLALWIWLASVVSLFLFWWTQ